MRLDAARIANRAKREVIHRVPAVRRHVEDTRASLEAAHRAQLPPIEPDHQALVAEVRQQGAAVRRWDTVGLPGVAPLQPLLLQLADVLASRTPDPDSSSVSLSRDEMLEDPALWAWGLQPEVLDVVENYLGVAPRYFGPLVHRECCDGRTVDTRHWHRDIEDHRMFKMLVWLNDVDVDGGPFTWVDQARSAEVARELRYVGGFVDSGRFADLVPATQWHRVTGPRWTVGIADPCRIFHRAAPPVARDRFSVTFTWMTRRPFATIPAAPWRPDQLARATAGLDARQRACLPPAMTA